MLTALLSARKRTETGDLRGALRYAGRSVLQWQASLARSLGAERLICLSDTLNGEVVEIQREIEAEGGEFHAIRSSLQLVSLLRSDDTLLIFADGLIADPRLVAELTNADGRLPRAIFTLPPDHDLAAAHADDLERIDAARSWAGMSIIDARIAQKLADFPPDGDPVSMLLRLGLQSQTPALPAPVEEIAKRDWFIASDDHSLQTRENGLFRRTSPKGQWSAPLQLLAIGLARLIAPSGLSRGPFISGALTIGLLLIALALAWYKLSIASLIIATIALFTGAIGQSLNTIARTVNGKGFSAKYSLYFAGIADALVILLLVASLSATSLILLAIPIFAIGLTRIAAIGSGPRVAPFWNDRTLHLAGLVICAVYGVLSEALTVLGLLALLHLTIQMPKSVKTKGS